MASVARNFAFAEFVVRPSSRPAVVASGRPVIAGALSQPVGRVFVHPVAGVLVQVVPVLAAAALPYLQPALYCGLASSGRTDRDRYRQAAWQQRPTS